MKTYDVVRLDKDGLEELVSSWTNRETAELEVEELNIEDKGYGFRYFVRSRELPEIKGLATTVKPVSWYKFLGLFPAQTAELIERNTSRLNASHAVCFEVLDMSSSLFGERSCLFVGSHEKGFGCTLDEACTGRLGDVPSQFAYPVYYSEIIL